MIVGGTLATVTALIGLLQTGEPYLPASHDFVRELIASRAASRDLEIKRISDQIAELAQSQKDGLVKVAFDTDGKLAMANNDTNQKLKAIDLQLIETQLTLVSGQIRQTNSDLADLTLKERDLPNDSFIARRKNELNDDLRQLIVSQGDLQCQLQTAQGIVGRC